MNLQILFLLGLILSLPACLAPTQRRGTTQTNLANNSEISSNSSPFVSGTVVADNGTATPVATTTTDSMVTPNPTNLGFESCDFTNSMIYNASNEIGSIRICKNTIDEKKFRVKFDLRHNDYRVCFVPTYKDNNNNSAFLGSHKCTFNDDYQIREGLFEKNRIQTSQYPINGVMVMMEYRINSFFQCMDGNPTPAFQTPSSPYYPISVTYLCGIFIQSGEFLDISF